MCSHVPPHLSHAQVSLGVGADPCNPHELPCITMHDCAFGHVESSFFTNPGMDDMESSLHYFILIIVFHLQKQAAVAATAAAVE